ncbi:hypothetical protein D3C84_796940 [compost metagenome]
MKDWLIRTWSWALLETPMPNWSLLMLIVVSFSMFSIAIYYYRTIDSAYDDLNEAEQTIYKLRNPEASELSRSQISVLNNLSNSVQSGLPTNSRFLGMGLVASTNLDALELEITLDQLVEKGFIQISSSVGASVGPSAPTPTLCLTLKGKEFVLARRKRNAELSEQKKKNEMTESKPE